MATSPLGGRLLTGYAPSSTTADVCSPVGTSIARDYLANNLLHYADEHAQVRCAFTATVSGYSGGQGYITGRSSGTSADVWYPITMVGPFPIALRQDGRSYSLRIRIAGASSGGHAVKFRAVIAPTAVDAMTIANGDSNDSIFETTTTTSATPAWLTGTSQGTSAYATQIYLPAEYATAWTIPTDTLDDLAGDAAGVDQCLVSVTVFGSSANVGSIPRLAGLYLAEWVGPPA